MASKGEDVVGGSSTKRSWKRVGIKNSSGEPNNLPPQKFGKGEVMPYVDDWCYSQLEARYFWR